MKNRGIIFSISITVFVVVIVYFFFLRNDVTIKSIIYEDCIVHYKYSSSNFRNDESNIRTHGHGKSNELEYDIAKKELMKCLCDKYTKTKDKKIKDYIVNYVKNDEYIMHYYVANVASLYVSVDSLCKYNNVIFLEDTIFHNLCDNYNKTHENKFKEKILNNYQSDVGLRILFSRMIKIDKPNIDSICKYKDLIFLPMLID
jgi:hypothetical protein